jgi:hypothetical protein
MELRPSEIFYSQDSIMNKFGGYTPHGNTCIGETLDQLLNGNSSVQSIPNFRFPCSPPATPRTSSSDSNWRSTIYSCEFITPYIVDFIDINRFQKSNFLCFSEHPQTTSVRFDVNALHIKWSWDQRKYFIRRIRLWTDLVVIHHMEIHALVKR